MNTLWFCPQVEVTWSTDTVSSFLQQVHYLVVHLGACKFVEVKVIYRAGSPMWKPQ